MAGEPRNVGQSADFAAHQRNYIGQGALPAGACLWHCCSLIYVGHVCKCAVNVIAVGRCRTVRYHSLDPIHWTGNQGPRFLGMSSI